MLAVRFLRQVRVPLAAAFTSSPSRIPRYGNFDYFHTWMKLEGVKSQSLYTLPKFSCETFIFRRFRQYAQKLRNSGCKVIIGSTAVCGALGSMTLWPQIAHCADGSHMLSDLSQTLSLGASSSERSIDRIIQLIKKLVVPLFLFLNVWMKWGQIHPIFLAARVMLIFLFTKPTPSSVHIFVDQGSIHRVRDHQIILCFDTQFLKIHREGNLYNVRFTYNRGHMRLLRQAVKAAKYLNIDFLFPSVSKVRPVEPAPFVSISCNLNEEQTRAIQMILAYKGGSPYVIHGPPGTDKAATLIESILQIYQSQIKARILVCSTSNDAVDHLLDRLISEGSRMIKPSIFRLNALSRSFKDVNPDYIGFCCVEDFNFTCPSLIDLEKYRIVISTYTSASLLYTQSIKKGYFSHILLDDNGHASEPETMVPLSRLYSNKTVVLAGDPMQLGPVVFCSIQLAL